MYLGIEGKLVEMRNSRIGGIHIALTLAAILLAGCQLDDTSNGAANLIGVTAVDNPTLERRCGIDGVLVLDASSSVRNYNNPPDGNGAVDLVAGAGNAFLRAFSRTNSRLAVVSYNADPILQLGLTDVNPGTLAAGGAHTVAMGDPGGASGPVPETTGYSEHARRGSGTNWEAGLLSAGAVLTDARPGVPRIVVHVTDGRPTRHIDENGNVTRDGGRAVHVAEAAGAADVLKAAGIHVYAVGIGRAGDGSYTEDLAATSGPDVYDQGDPNDVFDASNDDVIQALDFEDLEAVLSGLANQLCGASLTVTKLASSEGAPDDYREVAGVSFTARPGAGSGFDWVLPNRAAASEKTAVTDASGRVQFQWDVFNDAAWGAGAVTMTETAVPGFVLNPQVACTRVNRDQSFTVTADPDTGTFTVPLAPGDTITCEVRNDPESEDDPGDPDPPVHICTVLGDDAIPPSGGWVNFGVNLFNDVDTEFYVESIHDSVLGNLLDENNPVVGDGYCRRTLRASGTHGCAWDVLMQGGLPGSTRLHQTEVVFSSAGEEATIRATYEQVVEISAE